MARKRMVDPTIWADEDFGQLSSDAMILFIGIISNADDEGRLPGNALYLASTILPYRGLTLKQASVIRDEVVAKMQSVLLYEVDNKEYIQLKNWASYQSIDRPSTSKYPPFDEDSSTNRQQLDPNRIEENRIERKRKEDTSATSLYVETFNQLFNSKYTVTSGRTQKLKARLETYPIEKILQALSNLSKSEFHTGKNDRGWIADPDFLIRNDESVDKWLNQTPKSKIKVIRSSVIDGL